MAEAKGKVLVTGASGYIAGFIIKALVAEGWSVRGTIRNLARADEVRATLSLPDLELVACDLMGDAGWAEAMRPIASTHCETKSRSGCRTYSVNSASSLSRLAGDASMVSISSFLVRTPARSADSLM